MLNVWLTVVPCCQDAVSIVDTNRTIKVLGNVVIRQRKGDAGIGSC